MRTSLPRPTRWRRGDATRRTRSAAGTGWARATAADSGCTFPRCSSISTWSSSSTTPATTERGPNSRRPARDAHRSHRRRATTTRCVTAPAAGRGHALPVLLVDNSRYIARRANSNTPAAPPASSTVPLPRPISDQTTARTAGGEVAGHPRLEQRGDRDQEPCGHTKDAGSTCERSDQASGPPRITILTLPPPPERFG